MKRDLGVRPLIRVNKRRGNRWKFGKDELVSLTLPMQSMTVPANAIIAAHVSSLTKTVVYSRFYQMLNGDESKNRLGGGMD